MATPAAKLANIQSTGASPIPKLKVASMPAKLKSIDPAGCAQFEREQQAIYDEWWRQINTLNIFNNQQVDALARK